MNTIITSEGLLNIKLEEIQKEHGLPFKGKKPNPFVNVIEKEMKQQNPTIAMLIAMQSNIYERYVYPENQRNPEEGWTDKDREEYIITVIENTHKNTPCILNVVKKNKTEAARKRLIDGGHRIVAICAFTKNILKVNGRYYNQYSEEEQREFESREIIINEYKDLTESEEQSMMAIVNRHLNMSPGEYCNTYAKTDPWVIAANKILDNNDISKYMETLYGKDTRKAHLHNLNNIAVKYARLKTGNKKTLLNGERNYDKIQEKLHEFYLDDDYAEVPSRVSDLRLHIYTLYKIFTNVNNLKNSRFDVYAAQYWIENGVINSVAKINKAAEFFKKVYDEPNDAEYEKWRGEELKSGHVSPSTRFMKKTQLLQKYFENNST